jgi:quinol-cytochrome oxidoreductase complex cytochrome b subunit
LALQNDMLFGRLTRSVHHWSANLLVAVVLLHLARVYLTGAYHPPRQFNWVIGLALLCGVLAQNFTGYLLPWDQLSYWATTIVTSMLGYVPVAGGWLRGVVRGGDDIGSAALINFYTFHTTILPLLVVLLMAWHFWRVRKARGVVVPRAPGEARDESPEQVLTLPSLLLREFVVALVLVACVLVFSMFVAAPLGDAANPGMSPNPAKAPWYFVGFQELLLHFHPFFAVVVLPILAGLALLLVPYLPYEKDSSGIFMISRRGRKLGIIAAGAALVVTTLWVVLDEVWIDFGAWLPFLPASIGEGLLPVALLLALLAGFYLLLRGRLAGSRDEAVQSMFLFLTAAFLVLTLTGVWFRGEGMALVWPWDL